MEAVLAKIPEIIELVSMILGGLTIVATGVAKVSGSKTMQTKAKKTADVLQRVVEKLPTLGTNPNTKKLKEELLKLKKK